MSGIAFTPLGTAWPSAYQDSLFFSDFLRGCIWRFGKDANGQPDASKVAVFAQTVGAPAQLLTGPGWYSTTSTTARSPATATTSARAASTGISYVGPTQLTVKSAPKKVKIKVDGKRHRAPYRTTFDSGTVVKLVAPKVHVRKGVRYVFKKWKGVSGKKAKKKRKLTLTVGDDAVSVKAVYQRVLMALTPSGLRSSEPRPGRAGAVAAAEHGGMDEQREQLVETLAVLPALGEGRRVLVGGIIALQMRQAEQREHREVELAVPAVRRGVDQPDLALLAPEHVAVPQVAVQPGWWLVGQQRGELADHSLDRAWPRPRRSRRGRAPA